MALLACLEDEGERKCVAKYSFYQPQAESNRGVGSGSDFCFLAMVSSFSLL